MEDERLQIEELKLEWKEKLAELQRKEQEFDEKVVLAKSNMNEVVFQKGLSELLKKHNEELKYELRQHVDKEMVKDETEHIREECNQQVLVYCLCAVDRYKYECIGPLRWWNSGNITTKGSVYRPTKTISCRKNATL